MTDVCENCNKTVTPKSLEVLHRYPELKDNILCPVCRDEKLKELGYVCKACKENRVEPGYQICYNCRKKGLTGDETEVEKIEEAKQSTLPVPPQSSLIIYDPTMPVVRPLLSPEEARKEWKELQKLKRRIEEKDDYIMIPVKGGAPRKFHTKKYFRKLAMYAGLSDEIVREEITLGKIGQVIRAYYIVRVIAPNGRICTGVGVASRLERNFAHPDHDIMALAHTRAKTRAISDMVAGGETFAEEMGHWEEEKSDAPKSDTES